MDEVLNESRQMALMMRCLPDGFLSRRTGPMPDIKIDGQNGVLRFGTSAVTEPMSYVTDRKKWLGLILNTHPISQKN